MKKVFIITAFAFVTLASCRKELSYDAFEHATDASKQFSSIVNNSRSTSAADPTRQHLKIDLTGLTFRNDCTGEQMLIKSGIVNVNLHQDGQVASINIHNFVLESSNGTVYRGIFVINYTATGNSNGVNTLHNTYKAIFTTPGGGNNSVLIGVFHITINANEVTTAFIDNFRAGCK